MGTWGPGIFEDDLAADIRLDFEDSLQEDMSVEAATRRVLDKYAADIEDPDDGPVIWFALAALQLDYQSLHPDVRDRALAAMENPQHAERWREAGSSQLEERMRVLEDLRERLSAVDQKPGRRSRVPARKRPRPKIGDCFVMPLSDGRKAYGQYVYYHPEMGQLVQVLDLFTEEEIPVERLRDAGALFPPVFTGLTAAIRDGQWRIIGRLPVEDFNFPKFRYLEKLSLYPGLYHNWLIWNGEKYFYIGDLPAEYRTLELLQVWGYELLMDRIATGENLGDKLL